MEAKNFYAPVAKVLTSEVSPEYFTNNYNEFSIVVTDQEKKIIVSQCSKDYCLIPNDQIFPSFEEELRKDFPKFQARYKIRNYSQFHVEYALNGQLFEVTKKDRVVPMIKVSHSYNRVSSFKVSFGYYRLVCTNGLFMYKADKEYSFKHFIGNQKDIFAKIRVAAKNFIEKSAPNIQQFQLLQDRMVENIEQRVEEVIAATKYMKRSQQDIIERVLIEQKQLGEATDWLIYNAFNYQLNHNEGINSPEERKMLIDREVFDFLVNN